MWHNTSCEALRLHVANLVKKIEISIIPTHNFRRMLAFSNAGFQVAALIIPLLPLRVRLQSVLRAISRLSSAASIQSVRVSSNR